ncbi:hypothetical protein FH972_021800 [Carpinus fangiana]|uniref:Uncharacterized protein n=1 Tax=Carpinus fangiana TaxID=176857 RepID=A0A5N6KQC6_9ROSI|nr:hypothetical protein FH972_021800 [Carpinus fangiana]
MASPAYTNRTCTTGCTSFDLKYSNCKFARLGTLVQCVCLFGGDPTIYTGALNACTVCNLDGLGGNDLSLYQKWAVVCNEYANQGDEAAENLADYSDPDRLTEVFSSTLLPQLQAQNLVTATPTVGIIDLGATDGSSPIPTSADGSTTLAGVTTTGGEVSSTETQVTTGIATTGGTSTSLASSSDSAVMTTAMQSTSPSGTTAVSPATTSGAAVGPVQMQPIVSHLALLGIIGVALRWL